MERAKRPPAQRLAAILAAVAIALYVVAAVLFAVPVESPIQDCGAPGAYLLSGRIDAVPDERGLIVQDGQLVELEPDVADAVRRSSCTDRVAARAVPAGILLAAGFVIGLTAMIIEMVSLLRHRRRTAPAPAPPPPPVPPLAGLDVADAAPAPPDPER